MTAGIICRRASILWQDIPSPAGSCETLDAAPLNSDGWTCGHVLTAPLTGIVG